MQAFAYDDLNRLTQAASPVYGALTYNYDQIGNILAKENINYTYGGPRPHAVTSLSNGKTYSYDANGNIVSDGQRAITYNFDNMPAKVGSVNFIYDGNGSRIKKYINTPAMIYIDKFYECSGACMKYIYAGDKRIASKSASQVLYYHSDHLGSASIITDALGAKAEDISYLPFGKIKQDSGTVTVSHKFTGQEHDYETGLDNYGARLYDPELGRFLTPDSIVPNPKNPQALNRYSYVINNPMAYSDPSGHGFWSSFWNSLVEAFTHPSGEISVGVSFNTDFNSSYSNNNNSTIGNNGSNSSASVNIGTSSGNASATPSATIGTANPASSIKIYGNGEWASANSVYNQALNNFQGTGYNSQGTGSRLELKFFQLDGTPFNPANPFQNNGGNNGLTGGVAFDAGFGYGTQGASGTARSQGTGMYAGLNNGKFEYGFYDYKAKSDDIMGARAGVGFNVGYYNTSANTFFDGESLYGAFAVVAFSGSTNYSADGKRMGSFIGFGGKGYGLSWENGISKGRIAPIR